MSKSRWGEARDNTVSIVLVALIIGHFLATVSLHGQMADMESRLGERITGLAEQTHEMGGSLSARINEVEARLSDRIHGVEKSLSDRMSGMEKRLSDRITRLETLMEIHLEAHSTQPASGGVR